MVLAKSFVCVKCGTVHRPKERMVKCNECGGPLDIIYDYKKIEEVMHYRCGEGTSELV